MWWFEPSAGVSGKSESVGDSSALVSVSATIAKYEGRFPCWTFMFEL